MGTPAARQRSDLVNEITRYILAPQDADVQTAANDGISEAIRKLNTRPWAFMLKSQDIALVADQDEYALSAATMAPRSAELLLTTDRPFGRLSFLDPKTFDSIFPNRSFTGHPTHYTIFSFQDTGTLTLNVPPASSFVSFYPKLRIRHYARLQYPAFSTSTLDVPSEVENFIVAWAQGYVSDIWDPSKSGRAYAKAQAAWTELLKSEQEQIVRDWDAWGL